MREYYRKALILCFLFLFGSISVFPINTKWKASRITSIQNQNATNTWIDFKKDFFIEQIPETVIAKIACDSKYWMWTNGELVVFEGELKKGAYPGGYLF